MDQNKWQKINSSSKLIRPLQLKKLKQTISGTSTPFIKNLIPKQIKDKPAITKQKQSSSTNIMFSNQNSKMNSTDKQQRPSKRIDLKRMSSKNDSVFDDYYQKKPSPQLPKDKKQQISLSGDSFQSEGFTSLKKPHNSPKSHADKKANPIKNIVASPIMNPQDNRGGYKSPANRPVNRNQSQEQKTTGKRILSFGGKKIMAGRFFEDGDAYNKKTTEPTGLNKPGSPLAKSSKYLGLNLSDQMNKKFSTKQNTSNEDNAQSKNNKNAKNIPKFISNPNIKSSPYLLKHNLDSSNQISGDRGLKAIQKFKKQLINDSNQQKRTKPSKQDQQKSLTFNKGQMFLSLKKRQQQHSIRSKQLSMLGASIDIKTYTSQGQKQLKITLIKKINQSKKTCIYLAYHEVNAFWYCLKKTSLTDDKKKHLQQAIKQYKIQQFCCHPHLVKSFCFAYDQHDAYLIMEYMESQTLRQELKNELLKNMSEQNAAKAKINQSVTSQISKINKIRKILFQILSGLAFLHQKSIVHRDIKPDNIFISHDTYKLGDFGSAAKIGCLEYVGTLDYAAPEILTQSPYDERVDIWSLACIAYELDVGRPPFFHINPEETKRLAINGQYDKMLISDGELKILIEKMLQVNRKFRVYAKDLLKTQFFQDLHQRNLLF